MASGKKSRNFRSLCFRINTIELLHHIFIMLSFWLLLFIIKLHSLKDIFKENGITHNVYQIPKTESKCNFTKIFVA